jgi:hypothetical protein
MRDPVLVRKSRHVTMIADLVAPDNQIARESRLTRRP